MSFNVLERVFLDLEVDFKGILFLGVYPAISIVELVLFLFNFSLLLKFASLLIAGKEDKSSFISNNNKKRVNCK